MCEKLSTAGFEDKGAYVTRTGEWTFGAERDPATHPRGELARIWILLTT